MFDIETENRTLIARKSDRTKIRFDESKSLRRRNMLHY